MTTLPILFVPGVMGTRLVDPDSGDQVWNPTGDAIRAAAANVFTFEKDELYRWGELTADEERLKQVDRPLIPNTWGDSNDNEISRKILKEHRDGFNAIGWDYFSLVPDFYAHCLDQLSSRSFLETLFSLYPELNCPVHVVGYDWRQSNAKSAITLADRITRVLKQYGCEKVILIAHSMGGLVSRYFCSRYWPGDRSALGAGATFRGEDKVLGLILVGSPTFGAAKPFLTLKTGKPDLDDTKLFLYLFQRFGSGVRDLARHFPSVYQLLPTATYNKLYPTWFRLEEDAAEHWNSLRHQSGTPPILNLSEPDALYADSFVGLMDAQDSETRVTRNLQLRAQFHSQLGDYVHPNTYAIYSQEHQTICGIQVNDPFRHRVNLVTPMVGYPLPDSAQVARTEPGDGSVPLLSAKSGLVDPQKLIVGGGEHGKMCNHPKTLAAIRLALERMIVPHFKHASIRPHTKQLNRAIRATSYPRRIRAALEWDEETVCLFAAGETGQDPLSLLRFSLSSRRVDAQESVEENPWLQEEPLASQVKFLEAGFTYGEGYADGLVLFCGRVYLHYDRQQHQLRHGDQARMQHPSIFPEKSDEHVKAALRYDEHTVLLTTNRGNVRAFDPVSWQLVPTASVLPESALPAFEHLVLGTNRKKPVDDGFNDGKGHLYLFRERQYAIWDTFENRASQPWTAIPLDWRLA